MKTKQETLESLPNKTSFSRNEITYIIQQVKTYPLPPTKYKKGDVIIIKDTLSKRRPSVVIKQLDNTVVVMSLSTTKDDLNLIPYTSRFYGTGYINNHIMTLPLHYANDNFIGVFDNTKVINKAIKLMLEFMVKL